MNRKCIFFAIALTVSSSAVTTNTSAQGKSCLPGHVATVHLQFGFTSIKLMAVTSAGPQFGPPGYETDLLYIASLIALVFGGAGPLSVDSRLPWRNTAVRSPAHSALENGASR